MTISAYVGKPGHGKSYGVIENVVIPAFKLGRHVITNIPLNGALIKAAYPDATFDQIDAAETAPEAWLSRSKNGAVFVIDEAWRFWPSGVTVDQIPKAERSFFAEHRHRTNDAGHETDIVLVVQDLGFICAFVRQLVEVTYLVKKHWATGFNKRFKVVIYGGAVTGNRPPQDMIVRAIEGRYKPLIYEFYKSHTQSSSQSIAGKEVRVDGRGNVWRSKEVVFGAIAMLVAPFVAYYAWSGLADGFGGAKPEQTTTKPKPSKVDAPKPEIQPVVAAPAVAPTEPAPPAPAPAQRGDTDLQIAGQWRVAGVMLRSDGTGVAILRSSSATRRIAIEDHCRKVLPDLDLVCDVDGQRITYWSGTTGAFGSAAITDTALKPQ